MCSRAVASLIRVLAVSIALCEPPAALAQAEGDLLDPLPDPVVSGATLILEPLVQLPPSQPTEGLAAGRGPTNRINFLGELPDGTGRLYVPDLNGTLYLIVDGAPVEYLDVRKHFMPYFWDHAGRGSGFGFVAFHPRFAENGRFYTVHTEGHQLEERPMPDLPHGEDAIRHGIITEWTAEDPAANTFSGTRRELLRLGFATNVHGIQQIGFNPTAQPGDEDYGLLYVGAGDGGGAVGTEIPQDRGRPEGSILRIDPLGTDSSNGRYGIPETNPFVGEPGAIGEIYAYGLRNPHRFSWDPEPPHRMYVGNIGEWQVESVYEVRTGDNFGWPYREGPLVLNPETRWLRPLPEDDSQYPYAYPVAAYDHNRAPGQRGDAGSAVVGGFVYRGAIEALRGKYVFGDTPAGRLFWSEAAAMRQELMGLARVFEFRVRDESGRTGTMQELTGLSRVDMKLGTDGAGELYVLSKETGSIWRVTGAQAATVIPELSDPAAISRWILDGSGTWEIRDDMLVLSGAGTPGGPIRRPAALAILEMEPVRRASVTAELRSTAPVDLLQRDLQVIFGYQSPTRFYYVHLSAITDAVHNGIFLVDDADRRRIDDGTADPQLRDQEWHHVRVERDGETGLIEVYVDHSDTPALRAIDSTVPTGRVGFGSFDDTGEFRQIRITNLDR